MIQFKYSTVSVLELRKKREKKSIKIYFTHFINLFKYIFLSF